LSYGSTPLFFQSSLYIPSISVEIRTLDITRSLNNTEKNLFWLKRAGFGYRIKWNMIYFGSQEVELKGKVMVRRINIDICLS
jgi:hypothetical protein